jgi:hypothetical protein
MRRFGWVRDSIGRLLTAPARRLVLSAVVLLLSAAVPCPAADPPAIFPAAPYDGYIIYESLAVFWIAIIGLLVIIRMKLREIERTQALGADREDQDAPLLQ